MKPWLGIVVFYKTIALPEVSTASGPVRSSFEVKL